MRPNRTRSKFAVVALYFMIGILAVMMLSMISEMYVITKIYQGNSMSLANTYLYTLFLNIVSIAYMALYAVSVIAFILWFTRAYRNLQILMPKSKFYYKPWAAVVSWFIPVWNVFGPYNIATNLFDKTERFLVNEERIELRPKYDIVKGWWWALWIMSSIVIRMSEHYTNGNLFSNLGRMATVIGFIISILCAIFAVKMIRNYREMEELIMSSDGTPIGYNVGNDDLLDSGI